MGEELLKNKYVLGKKLKKDAVGWLWSAVIRETGQPISAREYQPNLCHPSIAEKLHEASLSTAKLSHPNVVRILDSVYTDNGRFFIIYDTPYHGSLAELLKKIDKFPLYDSQAMIMEIAKAVEYAHQAHILHGGLNPENIDVLANGEIKVRNFYIDQLLNSFLLSKGQNLLNTSYLTPEQIRGEKLTKATDVLALGALFYQLLSGRAPYPVITSLPQILKNYLRAPEKLTIVLPDLPKYIEDIIFKSLQHNQLYRQQSVTEFIGDLRQKKVTIAVEELKRRDAAGQLAAPPPAAQPQRPAPYSAKPPEYANIYSPEEEIIPNHRERKRMHNMPEQPSRPAAPQSAQALPKKGRSMEDYLRQLVFLALLGVFAAILVFFIGSVFHRAFDIVQVEVPDVLYLPVDEAGQVLRNNGLKVKLSGYINKDDLTPNHVVELRPEPGRIVKKGRIIQVYASRQVDGITAPNLIEHTLQSAEPVVADRGLSINIIERVYSNRYAPNQIISQSPEAGESLKRGEKINVTVSNGYPVWWEVKEKTDTQITVALFMQNDPAWEPQNVVVYLQDRRSRRKYAEKLLRPGDKDRLEITTDLNGIIEVYYFNDLARRIELKYDETTPET